MIIIRADSGYLIGNGHIMRCKNLLHYLTYEDVLFISRNHINSITLDNMIKLPVNIEVLSDPKSWIGSNNDVEDCINIIKDKVVELLIIDHYGIDKEWEDKVKPYVDKILVIDDLANREHNCDILLDQNITEYNYGGLVSPNCRILLGMNYLIMNPLIYRYSRKVRTKVKNVNIYFGGSDHHNLEETIIKYLPERYEYDIITNKNIEIKCENIRVYPQLSQEELYELYEHVDMSISAGGTSVYEKCYLGIPSLIITIADNQKGIAEKIEEKKMGKYLGYIKDINLNNIENEIVNMNNNIEKYSKNCINNIKKIGNYYI